MKNIKIKEQKGFTLVELAIVLTIVGLLIGGILKGQQLIMNARVTATVAQIKAIEAATTSFRDAYGGLPGDLKNSQTKIEGCTTLFCYTNADGIVGNDAWTMEFYQAKADVIADAAAPTAIQIAAATAPGVASGSETLLFWYSLEKSGLLSAVKIDAIKPAAFGANAKGSFGKTIPKAKIGGGFWVGYSSGIQYAGRASSDGVAGAGKYTLFGTIITLVGDPIADLTNFAYKTGATTADIVANIDRKIDDGLPNIGSIQAYGYQPTCYGSTATATIGAAPSNAELDGLAAGSTTYTYKESATTSDCGIHIRIQQ